MSQKHNANHLFRSGAVAGLLACLGALAACGSDSSDSLGTAVRVDPGTNKYYSLEGPYWVASGNYLLFSDVLEKDMATADGIAPAIHKYDPATGMFSMFAYPATTPTSTNGLGMDSMGRLIVTERFKARLMRVETNNMLMELAKEFEGMTLNAPNDVVVGPNDNIYFTDTLWGSVKKDNPPMVLGPNSAYRRAPDGTLTRILMSTSINGIALSPDNKTLYVGNDMENKVWKFTVNADGSVDSASQTEFLTKASVPGDKFRVPDGINVDDDGNVYVALNDWTLNAVAKFGPDGKYIGKYDVPVLLDTGKDPAKDGPGNGPSNVSFGGPDRKTMYITTHHALWKVDVKTPGKP